MRFYEKGPSLPDKLLYAQDEGRVVFFCGSGVSMAKAKLPDFMGLARDVLEKLGVTHESEALNVFKEMEGLQQRSGVQGLLAADVIFGLLTRDFLLSDINRAVAQCLIPPKKPNLRAHKTLLRLAKQQDGSTRLITTNFDLLFEACSLGLKSRTRFDLPIIENGGEDWGIVHLHGKVRSDYSGPETAGFVLSSAEFGDAYLAQGWARDFVHKVLINFTPVFIGYSADDPPVRYLLEGLRQTREPKHKIYAFQSGGNKETVARWSDKGVDAIIYDPEKNHHHLWQTLGAWAERNDDPSKWRSKVFSMARRGPVKLKPHQRGMVAHIVSSKTGAVALRKEDLPIPADWLCVFDPAVRYHKPWSTDGLLSSSRTVDPYNFYHLDDDPPRPRKNKNQPYINPIPERAWDAFAVDTSDEEDIGEGQAASMRGYYAAEIPRLPPRLSALGVWIGKVSNEPVAVWWAGLQQAIHPEIIREIRLNQRGEGSSEISDAVKMGWGQIFELNKQKGTHDREIFLLSHEIENRGWSPLIVRQYTKAIEPTLKNGPTYSPPPTRSRRRVSVRRLIHIDVKYPDLISHITVPDEYLAPVVDKLRTNVERAIDLEKELSGWVDVCAIVPEEKSEDQDFARSYELSGYVMHFVGLFRRLLETDPKAAKSEIIRWRRTDRVFSRLRFWGLGQKALANGKELAEEILTMQDDAFWASRNQRDLLLVLKKRWNDFPEKDLKKIEEKILKGPTRPSRYKVKAHEERSAFIKLNWLHWLAGQGCPFSFELKEITENLKSQAPGWKPEFAKKAAESLDSRSGMVTKQTDWSSLQNLSLYHILEHAKKAQGHSRVDFIDYDPFLGLCNDAPVKALGALKVALKADHFYKEFWDKFLSAEQRKNDSSRLIYLIAGRLAQVPLSDFSTILLEASRWLKMTGPELRTTTPNLFERVWKHFLQAITHSPEAGKSAIANQKKVPDWFGIAINAPAGNLAELLMTDPRKEGLKVGQGFPSDWRAEVENLLNLPGESRQHSLAIFSFNLNWFFAIDPKLAEKNFLRILLEDGPLDSDKQAIWAGFFFNNRPPNPEIFLLLKPLFLKMVGNYSSFGESCARKLPDFLLWGWGLKNSDGDRLVSNNELRNAIIGADEEFRSHMLWTLGQWTVGDNQQWRDDLLDFLNNVWPKQRIIRTPKVSTTFCDLALRQPENYPAVIDVIVQLVSKINRGDMMIHSLLNETDSQILVHPRHTLKLLHAVLPDDPATWPYGTHKALPKLVETDETIATEPQFKELQRKLGES